MQNVIKDHIEDYLCLTEISCIQYHICNIITNFSHLLSWLSNIIMTKSLMIILFFYRHVIMLLNNIHIRQVISLNIVWRINVVIFHLCSIFSNWHSIQYFFTSFFKTPNECSIELRRNECAQLKASWALVVSTCSNYDWWYIWDVDMVPNILFS